MSFTTIQIRRGTLAAWTSANPVLALGEQGYETDTQKMKIGDGSTAYLSLPYFTGGTGLSTTLNDGNVSVGNASNVATGVAVSGDLTAVNTGAFTVAKIAGTTVSGTTGSGNVVFSTSPTLVTPALGTPSALVGTNITGTAAGLTAGTVTTNANLTGAVTSTGNATSLGSFSSANLAGALTDETGSGAAVFATSPSLVTPVLGTPTSGTLSNCTTATQTARDNSTKLASTAYVDNAASTIPQNSQSANYTTVLTDAGKQIYHPSADTTARTFTIDSNANVAYVVGTAITFVNDNSAGVITIAITSDTMRLAGAGTTGNRTLAANGIATALKITTTSWIISGTGLT